MAERAERVAAMWKVFNEALRLWSVDGEACEHHLWAMLTQASAAGDEDYRLLAEAGLMIREGDDESRGRATGLLDRANAWREQHVPDEEPMGDGWAECMRQAGDYPRAVALFERAAAAEPQNGAIRRLWALSLVGAGEYLAAARHYPTVIALLPKATFLWNEMAGALSQAGETPESRRLLDELLPSGSESVHVREFRAIVLGQWNLHEEAVAQFEAAARLGPLVHGGHGYWGMALSALRRQVEAIAHFDEDCAARPDYAWSHANWAWSLLILKQYDAAIDQARQALALDEGCWLAEVVWSWAVYHAGRQEAGWQLLCRSAIGHPPEVWPHFAALCGIRRLDARNEWRRLMAEHGLPTAPPA